MESAHQEPGEQCIGVGVGAMVFNTAGQIFLAQRGPAARNERGYWEFPGGGVKFGETVKAAIVREFQEEYQMTIEILELLGVADHILPQEDQHWVSISFIAQHIIGTPIICEPEKCTGIGWFALVDLPQPLSRASEANLRGYQAKYGLYTPPTR